MEQTSVINDLITGVKKQFEETGAVQARFIVYTRLGHVFEFDVGRISQQEELEPGKWVERMIQALWPFRQLLEMSVFISESWMTPMGKGEEDYKSRLEAITSGLLRVSQMPDRVETVMIAVERHESNVLYFMNIIRDGDNADLAPLEVLASDTMERMGRAGGMFNDNHRPSNYTRPDTSKLLVAGDYQSATEEGVKRLLSDVMRNHMADILKHMVKLGPPFEL